MAVNTFEELEAWQLARQLNRMIYSVTGENDFSKDWALRDQIRRASISIMSNIAEGFDRYNRKEFAHFLSIAKGSCAEVRCQLVIASDVGYLDLEVYERLNNQAIRVNQVITKLRQSLTT